MGFAVVAYEQMAVEEHDKHTDYYEGNAVAAGA